MPIIWPLWIAGTAAYGYYRKDEITGAISEISKEQFEKAAAEGATVVAEEVGALLMQIGQGFAHLPWEEIGEAVGKAASEVIKATTEVTSGIAKEIVPDLIEGVERGYDVIRTKLSGAEADVISAFVVGFLVIFTMIYLFYEIRRGK